MGQTFYAQADRETPLTDAEVAAIEAIINECGVEGEMERFGVGPDALNWESFFWTPNSSDDAVFSGSTRLPDVTMSAIFTGIDHWGKMIGRIRAEVLADAVWDVNVDGDPVRWILDEQRFGIGMPAGLDLDAFD